MMEQFSVGFPERDIKIEDLDIKTEFHDEDTHSNESDTQFNAVIFGTAKYNTQNTEEMFRNDNEDVKSDILVTSNAQNETLVTSNSQNDTLVTSNSQNDTLVNLDTKNIPTDQKRKRIRGKSLEERNIKNENKFYSKNSEENIYKNKLLYRLDDEVVGKNEIDFTDQFLMNTEINYEEQILAENVANEVISKELSFTCKKRKMKKENHTKYNNVDISVKEEILPENENFSEINCKREEFCSKLQENVKIRKEICHKTQENLEIPLLIPIKEKKTYICNECGYNFNHLGNLKRHISRLHTVAQNKNKSQAFSCSNCAFKCSNESTLEKHNKKHKDKPFSCGYCDYTTRHRNGLNRHLRIHTGEKRFTCEICDRKCTTKRGLEFHIMIHSGKKPFSCDKCDFKAVNKHDITRHARIHTGEKPFSCEICGYACIRKYHLNLHMRKHLREC